MSTLNASIIAVTCHGYLFIKLQIGLLFLSQMLHTEGISVLKASYPTKYDNLEGKLPTHEYILIPNDRFFAI